MTPADVAGAAPALDLLVAFVGALFGSFLNVVIHRLPRRESVVFPASHCGSCRTPIHPWDNIPVVSWLLLRGRCRSCRTPISLRYPLVELAGGAITWLLYRHFGLNLTMAAYLWFCLALLAVTLIDLEHRIIPDVITLPGTALGLLLVSWTDVTWIESLTGAALGFGVLLGVGVAYEKATGVEGMGGGDVKLAAMMGAFLGWQGVVLAIFLGAFLGSLVGVAAMAGGKGTRRTALPFGTFLAPAAVIVLFVGSTLVRWYLSLFQG